jgi:multiple sugar transport system ATP-binding protein
MADISLLGVVKRYENTTAVDEVTLEIGDGEFFVFVGPSGSGKSTLLRLIAGLIKPSSGDIKFGQRSVTSLDARDRNVAMVFQNYALYPHKNVFDNIAFGLRARRVPGETVTQKVTEASRLLGIDTLLSRWPRELSGGERQRVAIGRALVRDPEVYLLDEPLSNLDARLRLEMRNEIAKIHSSVQTTFVYVTHDQTEAMTLGDRIAVINKGRIEQIDTPERLYKDPSNLFVAGFIGSPPMNIIDGEFVSDDGRVEIVTAEQPLVLEGILKQELPLDRGERVAVGFRPEALKLAPGGDSRMRARVIRVEPIGYEGFVYLDLAREEVVARVRNWEEYRERTYLSLELRLDEVYLFSSSDGRCLWGRGEIPRG